MWAASPARRKPRLRPLRPSSAAEPGGGPWTSLAAHRQRPGLGRRHAPTAPGARWRAQVAHLISPALGGVPGGDHPRRRPGVPIHGQPNRGRHGRGCADLYPGSLARACSETGCPPRFATCKAPWPGHLANAAPVPTPPRRCCLRRRPHWWPGRDGSGPAPRPGFQPGPQRAGSPRDHLTAVTLLPRPGLQARLTCASRPAASVTSAPAWLDWWP